MKNIVELYWIVDEIVKQIVKQFSKKVGRKSKLTRSELITMALIGHFDGITTDKKLYEYITTYLKNDFKKMPCYEQFTRGIRSISKDLDFFLQVLCQLSQTDKNSFYIVDSTALPTNGYNQYQSPKWASTEAKSGKNIFGYYHGFKLHIIINRNLEVVSFLITSANVHDIQALRNTKFIENIQGLLIGDKGYVASESLLKTLKKQGLNLLFKQRENMDPYLNEYYYDYLRQRQVVEGVFSYLKNRLVLLHTFARSVDGFLVHVKAALAAYMLRNLDLALTKLV